MLAWPTLVVLAIWTQCFKYSTLSTYSETLSWWQMLIFLWFENLNHSSLIFSSLKESTILLNNCSTHSFLLLTLEFSKIPQNSWTSSSTRCKKHWKKLLTTKSYLNCSKAIRLLKWSVITVEQKEKELNNFLLME